jgi:putative tryptophan/tyrosine transport system substrate-binding protein
MPNPIIGFLHSGSEKPNADNVSWFNRGLAEAGYVDEDDVDVRYGFANDDVNQLRTLARQFVNVPVNVIVAAGGPIAAVTARDVTNAIPIVFTTVSDPGPTGNNLVDDYERPNRNLTGTAGLTSELDPKRLELLKELLPAAANIGVLRNNTRPNWVHEERELAAAAARMVPPLNLVPRYARNLADIDAAFASFGNVDAVLVTADPVFNNRRKRVVNRARQIAKPAIYQWREFVEVRGLMSYGPSIKDAYYQTGIYVGRILDGGNPATMPVILPDKFELVINLRTANRMRIRIPVSLLTRAILVRH